MRAKIEPLTPHTGALVQVERAHLCDDEVVRACLDALETRGVLVFPRIGLSDDEQLAFTDKLGPRVNPTGYLAGGKDTAAAIPGAKLLMIEGMGHALPIPMWPQVVDVIATHANGASAKAA